jgi:diketogulonate reductase-like aldo/keto reductase
MADLMDSINKKDFVIFKNDFIQLIKVAYGMNDYYVKSDPIATKYMPKYKSIIKSFNKKYPSLKLKLIESYDLKLKVFIKTNKPLKDIFLESASKITGLKSIGSSNFGAADVSESEKFYNELETVKKEIYITYHAEQHHPDLLVLKLNKRQKIVEVEYEIEDLLNEHLSNFKICAYYALKEGYTEKIKLFEKSSDFGFISVLSEEEFKKILEKFNPLMHE